MRQLKSKLSKIDRNLLITLISQLKDEFGDDLILVKIFGSKARGDWNNDSDIDLLVVIRGGAGEKKKAERIIWQINDNHYAQTFDNLRISPIIYSQDEYIDAHHPLTNFMYYIEKDGKEVYGRAKKGN